MSPIFENMVCAVMQTKVPKKTCLILGFLVLIFVTFRDILKIDSIERQINPDKAIFLGKMKFFFLTKNSNNGYFHKKVIILELIAYFLLFCSIAIAIFNLQFDAKWPEILVLIWVIVVCIFAEVVKEIRNKLRRQLRRLILNDKL